MPEPRRDYFIAPVVDADTARVLAAALTTLGRARRLTPPDDPGVHLHLLVSLAAQVDRLLPAAVAAARAQDYSWAQIGDLLGLTRASAWQRFGP